VCCAELTANPVVLRTSSRAAVQVSFSCPVRRKAWAPRNSAGMPTSEGLTRLADPLIVGRSSGWLSIRRYWRVARVGAVNSALVKAPERVRLESPGGRSKR